MAVNSCARERVAKPNLMLFDYTALRDEKAEKRA
jgi:hypothetical protein